MRATHARHLALRVADLRAAEQYYQSVFDMELVGREAMQNDGLWYSLPFDRNWEQAEAAGIELGMCALRCGAFVLALFRAEVPGGQVYAVGLEMSAQEIARLGARLPGDTLILEASQEGLSFMDPQQIIWQITVPGNEFRTSGEIAGRWLSV